MLRQERVRGGADTLLAGGGGSIWHISSGFRSWAVLTGGPLIECTATSFVRDMTTLCLHKLSLEIFHCIISFCSVIYFPIFIFSTKTFHALTTMWGAA